MLKGLWKPKKSVQFPFNLIFKLEIKKIPYLKFSINEVSPIFLAQWGPWHAPRHGKQSEHPSQPCS